MTRNHHLIDSKKKFVFLIIILGSITAIGPLTIDMYLPAFLAIAKNFSASQNMVQLSLATYFIGLALSQLFYGPIIDRYGKKLPLFFGLCLFIISSIACCFANNIEQLIFWRFFQAMGACIGIVAPRAIVRDIFSPQESARVFSHLMLVMGLAPILAPLCGSFILGIFGWRGIFIFLSIFGIFCLLVSQTSIPQTNQPNVDEKISHAFKKYWQILNDRNFIICALCGSFIMSAMFVYITASPFAYLEVFNLSAKRYSLVFAANSFGFILLSQINAYFLKKNSIHKILNKILFLPAFAGIILILIGAISPTFWLFTITNFFFIASIGAIIPNTSALALSNHSQHSGSASAMLGTIQFSFATLLSFLISFLHSGNLTLMSTMIGVCGILSCLVYKIFKKDL